MPRCVSRSGIFFKWKRLISKGAVPKPVTNQIKDYLQGVDQKAKATNQFSIGARQFYSYYNRESKVYKVDEIKIKD